ncbi:MAG TPA: hypothetical protein VGF67_28870 [Ktedonobacteraceae bacterium]|jgi:hypothetical protein
MLNQPSPSGVSGSGGTPTAQLPQPQLASCPVYDPVSWTRRDQGNEPLYDVACYIYAIDWPNAGLADIHEVGDIYAYKQLALRTNLLKKSKGYLDALLEQKCLPKQQLTQLLKQIEVGGWLALSLTEQQQIVGLGDWLEVMKTVEEYKEGSFPQQLATQIFQAYVRTIKQCASLDGLIEIDVSPQTTLATIPSRQGCYLVALSFWFDPDGPDHHWYRLDTNSCWSHKPGQTQVRNVDSSNQLIRDPRTANLRPYAFCCFYYVPVAALLQGIGEAVDEFDSSSSDEEPNNDQQSSSEEDNAKNTDQQDQHKDQKNNANDKKF